MAYRLQVVTTGYNGAPGYNTFYALDAPTGDPAQLASDVFDLWAGLSSNLANGTVFSFDGTIETFDGATGDTTAVTTIAPWTGGGTWGTNKSPGGTCAVLQWRTGQYISGRELRGRSFISGLGDIGDGLGTITTGNLTDMGTAALAYAQSPGVAVYSPTHGTLRGMTVGTCWTRFGLMRSRRD